MILHEPFKISARLLPAMEFNGVWLSFDPADNTFYIDGLSKPYVIDTYRPGMDVTSIQFCFADIFSFMASAGEAVMWGEKDGVDVFAEEDSDANLFPREVSEWCRKYYCEFQDYVSDFEQGPDLITEG